MTGALDASYFGARSHARMGAQCTAIGARPVVASSHTRHKSARKIFVSLHGVAQATVPRISASHAARWRPPALAKALVPLSDRRACLFCECTSRAAPLMVVSAVHHFRYHHTEIMTGFYLDQLSFCSDASTRQRILK